MIEVDRHVYQILTKRPHRAARIIQDMELPIPEHIWIGTSVEDQTFADNRIPALTLEMSMSRSAARARR